MTDQRDQDNNIQCNIYLLDLNGFKFGIKQLIHFDYDWTNNAKIKVFKVWITSEVGHRININ